MKHKYDPIAVTHGVLNACRKRGHAEWLPCVEMILDAFASKGIDTKKVEIVDGWGDEHDYPYYWDGNGEFVIYYYSESQNEGERVRREITAILTDFVGKNDIHIEDKGSGGGREPWWWIRAKLTADQSGWVSREP